MHKCLFKSPLDMYNRFVIRLLVFHSLKFFCRNQRWSDLNRTSNFHGKQYLRLSSPFSISLFLEYFHQEKSTSFLVPMANYSHGDFFPLWNRGSYLQMPNLWWGSLNELSDPFVCTASQHQDLGADLTHDDWCEEGTEYVCLFCGHF